MDGAAASLKTAARSPPGTKGGADAANQAVIDGYLSEFDEAVYDDLNIPKALGVAWTLAKLDQKSDAVYRALLDMDGVLALGLTVRRRKARSRRPWTRTSKPIEAPAGAQGQDFATADRIRDELKAEGIILEDTPDGVKWRQGISHGRQAGHEHTIPQGRRPTAGRAL